MKILSCCPRGYYAEGSGLSYEYVSFVEVPRRMGHHVHHYEYLQAAAAGREQMNDFFLSLVRHGGYDLVIIMTYQGEFPPEVLDEARRYVVTMAWNCDDDWRWEEYSSKWIEHYTYMVTTYRPAYKANKNKYPNLLLSQWGCTGLGEGFTTPKDIHFSFVGYCYGRRSRQIKELRNKLGLIAYGKGVKPLQTWKNRWKQWVAERIFSIRWENEDRELPDQEAVKDIWNRSRLSFTPLEASHAGRVQLKARVFDMGLSGTVMLCTRNPDLYEFYEPGKEFVEFESIDECIAKAKYLLSHERERAVIAQRYYERTKAEHLWSQRYATLFHTMGLS